MPNYRELAVKISDVFFQTRVLLGYAAGDKTRGNTWWDNNDQELQTRAERLSQTLERTLIEIDTGVDYVGGDPSKVQGVDRHTLGVVATIIQHLLQNIIRGGRPELSDEYIEDLIGYGNVIEERIEELLTKMLRDLPVEIDYEIAPNIPEIYEGLTGLKPHLSYDPRPALEDLGVITGQIYEGMHDGELQGEAWYANLLDKAWETIDGAVSNSLLKLWEQLQRVLLWGARANARFWWAMFEYVVDALWRDEDMDADMDSGDREFIPILDSEDEEYLDILEA